MDEIINTNNNIPGVYFENHEYCGGKTEYYISNFYNFSDVKTLIINNKIYYSSSDICRGLHLDTNHSAEMVRYALKYIIESCGDSILFIPNFIDELYFYVNIEIEHKIANGSMVKQIVKALFISEPIAFIYIYRSKKLSTMDYKSWMALEILPKLNKLSL